MEDKVKSINRVICILIATIIILPAVCNAGAKKLKTIEEAEAVIVAKGFTFENKKQDTEMIVGDRVYKGEIDGISVTLLQFNTEKAMNGWADMIDSSPIGGSRVIRCGLLAIQVWRGADENRQKIIQALSSD